MFNREFKFILLILVIFIAACIETDIYLPAFADMMAFYSISEEKIQGILTWNFIGICFSGPFYGPISDAIGRKKPLIFALSLFLIGSILTIFAIDFETMLLGRILQGLGSGGCFTLGTAIIFDVFQEKKAIEALNKINSIVPFIMALAPMLGGYLNQTYGFRSNFLAIAGCVLFSFAICLFFFDETLDEKSRVAFSLKKILGDFKKVSLSLPFWQTMLIVSLLFSGYLAFLSGISLLFVLELGVSKQALPFYQAALLGAWLVANLSYKRVLDALNIPAIKKIGTALVVLGGLGLALSAWIAPQNPYMPTLAMILYSFGANWVQGLYFPEGMMLFPEIKGISASILTSARLLVTACVVGLAGFLYDASIYPIAAVVFSVVFVIFLIIFFYERKKVDQLSRLNQPFSAIH